MRGQVVDAVERLAERQRVGLGRADADQQRPGEAGPGRDRDGVHLAKADPRGSQRPLDRGNHRLQVRPAGDLGYHAAEPGVLGHAGRDGIGEQFVAADQPDARLVARGLDSQHQRRGHACSPVASCRAPGTGSPAQRPPHDEGISARGLVIAAPDPDLGEVVPAVQLLRAAVVGPYLEEDLGAAAPGCLGQQRLQQRGADALAPAVGGHRQRQDVALPASAEQARVPGDLSVVLGDQVVPAGGLLIELARQHLPAPCLSAEDGVLEFQDRVDVGVPHRARSSAVMASLASDGQAPWRPGAAGTARQAALAAGRAPACPRAIRAS